MQLAAVKRAVLIDVTILLHQSHRLSCMLKSRIVSVHSFNMFEILKLKLLDSSRVEFYKSLIPQIFSKISFSLNDFHESRDDRFDATLI